FDAPSRCGFFPAPTPPIRWICHDAEGRCANFRAESARQRMNRRGTIYFLKSLVAPLGFALEGLTVCEKGLRENRKEMSPPRESRTTSRRAACNASKTSTGFCSPGNDRQ